MTTPLPANVPANGGARRVRTVLLANVGQRDVQLDGKEIKQGSESPSTPIATLRAAAKAILDDFPQWSANLTTPIIDQAIDAIAPSVGGEGRPAIDQLIVYGTDQPATVDQRFRDGDTIYVAELAAKLIGGRQDAAVGSARVRPVDVANVNQADVMYQYFRKQFRGGDHDLAEARRDRTHPLRVLVSLAGGTPGANMGLLIAALEAFGGRVEAIHPSERGKASLVPIAAIVRRQALFQPVRELLAGGYFVAAATVIESWREESTRPVAVGARAVQRWLDFADDEALALVQEALVSGGDASRAAQVLRRLKQEVERRTATHPAFGGSHIDDRHAHAPDSAQRRFSDLYWAADLCLRQGRLVDFVARVTRLQEAILRWILGRILRVNAHDNGRKTFWPAARRLLTPDALPSKTPDEQRAIDIPALIHVTDSLGASATLPNRDTLRDLARYARCVDAVRDLRHRSVAGHAFEGVTEDQIAREVATRIVGQSVTEHITTRGSPAVMDCLRKMFDCIGLDPPGRQNPYLTFGSGLADALVAIDNPDD